MKLLLISDTHGEFLATNRIILEHPEMDYYFHLGDIGFDKSYFPKMIIVNGNHDAKQFPQTLTYELEGMNILLTHGDYFEYSIIEAMQKNQELWQSWETCLSMMYDEMVLYAKRHGYQAIFFGHTHTAHFEKRDGIYLCNPGSLLFSHDGRNPSYAILDVEFKEMKCTFYFLDEDK